MTDDTKFPHVTQLTFDDRAIALLTDSVQLALIAIGRHPKVSLAQMPKVMAVALFALESFESEVWAMALDKLHKAASAIEDERIGAKDRDGQEIGLRDDDNDDTDDLDKFLKSL
jgi:hypothetical protein